MAHDPLDEKASSWEQVSAGLFHPEWQVRVGAAKALIHFPEQVSIPVLMLALSDEHKAVRLSALETCAVLSRRVSVVLVKSMLLDPEWAVRATAAWALGRFADKAPLDDLLALLRDKTEVPLVRACALHTLGELGERVPIEVIVAALRDDEWPVRELAAITLGTLAERTPVEPLIYALKHDDVEFVRAASALSLGRLADRAPQAELVRALDDKEPPVCRAAAWALREAEKETNRLD
jgi:HEAT repeat protein